MSKNTLYSKYTPSRSPPVFHPKSFRNNFTSCDTKNGDVFSSKWKLRDSSSERPSLSVRPFSSVPHFLQRDKIRDKTCRFGNWFRWMTFWTFFVDCDFYKQLRWTVIKLVTFILNTLCQLQVKYYIVKNIFLWKYPPI